MSQCFLLKAKSMVVLLYIVVVLKKTLSVGDVSLCESFVS